MLPDQCHKQSSDVHDYLEGLVHKPCPQKQWLVLVRSIQRNRHLVTS